MAIDFPNSPTNGQTHVANGITYKYDSTVGAWLIDSYTSLDYVAPAYDAANAAFFKANSGSGAAIPILTDTVSAARYIIFSPSTTGNLTNANVSTTLVYNPATGNVGIGTANPTSNLHVIGTANISSTMKSAGLYDSTNRLLLIKNSAGTVVWGN